MEPLEVSSSAARERAARGEAIGSLVGEAVAGYIAAHGLYAASGQGATDIPGGGGAGG